jgi:hypothetical protein
MPHVLGIILIEHHKRIANGIDDGLREFNSVLEFDKRRFFRQRRS